MAVNGKKSKAKKLQMMLIMIIMTMMLMEITMIMTGKREVGKLFKTCVMKLARWQSGIFLVEHILNQIEKFVHGFFIGFVEKKNLLAVIGSGCCKA